MKRFHQILLIGTLLPLCWLLMQAVHEVGHVLGAIVSGGTVSRVVLHPLTISRTDLAENPHPLFVVWAGPVVGVLLPAVAYAISQAARFRWAFLVRFFAGFCLVANGAYIGAGSFGGIGDCGEMLRLGTPAWCLRAFGLVGVAAGLWPVEWTRPGVRDREGFQGGGWRCRVRDVWPACDHACVGTGVEHQVSRRRIESPLYANSPHTDAVQMVVVPESKARRCQGACVSGLIRGLSETTTVG